MHASAALRALATQVMPVPSADLIGGSLTPDTQVMLSQPARILKEWRIWVVGDQIVTASLYKEGTRVTYRAELDPDAQDFAQALITLNPRYAPAFVMDICRTPTRLALLETNCINAAGFYAADLNTLAAALIGLIERGD